MSNSSRHDEVGRVRAVYFFFKENSIFFFTMLSSTLCVSLLHQSTLTSQTLNTSTRLKRLLHENDQLPALLMCYCLSSLFEALR